jgi:hypothetical protein
MSLQPTLVPSPEKLVAEHKLLRLLAPELIEQIQRHHLHSNYIIARNDQLYLSLEHITDAKQREYYYQLIQCYQIGRKVNLRTLPSELQQILHSDLVPPSLFWGSLMVGAVAGLIVGVLAMAIGMLLLNVTAVTLGRNAETFNLQAPTIIFVFFAALGWSLASVVIWRRWKKQS